MMMKRLLQFLLFMVFVGACLSCGDDIEPIKEFYDINGQIFLEEGKMHIATTDFTPEQLQQRLKATAWKRNYAFYYDKKKAGKRNDIVFSEINYYVFGENGQANMGNIFNDESKTEFTYVVSGNNVDMNSAATSFRMRIVAIDDTMMVADSPMTGKGVYDYDDATVVQRTVFKSYHPIN